MKKYFVTVRANEGKVVLTEPKSGRTEIYNGTMAQALKAIFECKLKGIDIQLL